MQAASSAFLAAPLRGHAPKQFFEVGFPAMADKEGTIQLERYTTEAKQVVAGSQQIADERQHTEVTPLHLLVRLLERDRGVAEVFRRAGADPNEVLQLAEAQMRRLPRA